MLDTPAITPHNIEAEEAVLGAVVLSNGDVMGKLGWLLPGHFYRESHRAIWQAMQELHEAGHGIDGLVLTDHLRRSGTLELAGGVAAIDLVAGGVPAIGNYMQYARMVHAAAQDRRKAQAMLRMHEALLAGDEDAYRRAWEQARP